MAFAGRRVRRWTSVVTLALFFLTLWARQRGVSQTQLLRLAGLASARVTRSGGKGGGGGAGAGTGGTFVGGLGLSLVWVALGDAPQFQPYVLESIRQARVFNPRASFYIVFDDPRLVGPTADHPWLAELAVFRTEAVSYHTLTDPFTHDFAKQYERLWDELGRRVGLMMPTINHVTNMAFTHVTMVRLVALHQIMALRSLERVVHIENDQMTFGPISAVRDAADGCGVRLAMARVGTRLAASVVYARDAPALKAMLDFIHDGISHGTEHAIAVAHDKWATDMSLTAAYFAERAAAGDSTVATLPYGARDDSSCMRAGGAGGGVGGGGATGAGVPGSSSAVVAASGSGASTEGGYIFDGLPLGAWCCGSFEFPRNHFAVRMPESGVAYWDLPFEWRLAERPLGATARDPPPPAPGTDPRAHRAGGPADNPSYDATGAELPSEASKAAAAARAAALTAPAFFRIPVWNGAFESGGGRALCFLQSHVCLALMRTSPHTPFPQARVCGTCTCTPSSCTCSGLLTRASIRTCLRRCQSVTEHGGLVKLSRVRFEWTGGGGRSALSAAEWPRCS